MPKHKKKQVKVENPLNVDVDSDEEEAATKIQARARGNAARKKKKKAKPKTAGEMTEEEAATKIQAAHRGKVGRKKGKIRAKIEAKKEARAQKARAEKEYEEQLKIENDVSGLFEPGEGAYVRKGSDRDCTDKLCCAVFLIYWGGMCFLIWFAVTFGDIERLVRPRDMNANSCGLETGTVGSADYVDLRRWRQLYLPDPSDETKQICVDGCPGSSKGTCSGTSPLGENPQDFDYRKSVSDSKSQWSRIQEGLATLGQPSIGSGEGVIGPIPYAGSTLPWYDAEAACVAQGDCSDGSVDVSLAECTGFGRCINATDGSTVQPVSAFGCVADGTCGWLTSQRQTCQNSLNAGFEFTPFEFTPYTWEYDETDDSLFICMPKPGCTLPGCSDPDYPPTSFMAASAKGWLSSDGPCWMPVFPSEEYLYRCVPTMLTDLAAASDQAEGQQSVQYMKDLQDYWRIIPFGAVIAVLAAFVWIIFLGKFAYYLIWATVWGVEIMLPCISAVAWYKLGAIPTRSCLASSAAASAKLAAECLAADLSFHPTDTVYVPDEATDPNMLNCQAVGEPGDCTYTPGLFVKIPAEMQAAMDDSNTSQETTYMIAVGSLIVWAVFGVVFCIFRQRIMISIGVIEEASDAFLDVPFAAALPLLVLLCSIPVSAFCCVACFLLLSLRRVADTGLVEYCLVNGTMPLSAQEQAMNPDDCAFPSILQGMFYAQMFGWLWTVQWFLSIQYCSIAGAISKWYFTPENIETHEKKISAVLLSHSVFRTLRHHSGTAALGSFVVAVVIIVKFWLIYLINQIQAQSPENKMIKILGTVLKVLVACVERFIRFVGHLVYIETAIYGTNFCHSLYKSVKALALNAVRFSFVTLFSKLILLLGKLLVVAAAVALSIFAMPLLKSDNFLEGAELNMTLTASLPEQPLPPLPLALVCFFAITISINIMGIYETAIDTIMVSFLEDEKENDGNGKVSFASGPLKSFMKGTKSIADAQKEYRKAVIDAKTNRIRAREYLRQCPCSA